MIQRPFISSRYDSMKHPTQIPEEVVNSFINESMKTKTMLEAKKKAKNYDYSNEGGAGERDRQESQEPQDGKKESKWSKFKKAMNNAAGRVTSGDRFIRDTGMKMDHQEHEGDLQNELSADLAGRASRLARAKQGAALKQGKVWKGLRKGTQSNRFQAYSGEESRKKGSGPAARQTLKRRQNKGAPGWGKTFPPQIPPAVLDRISIGENFPDSEAPQEGPVAAAERKDRAVILRQLQNSHQEHEGDGINELTPASNPNSWAARAIASRQQKVKGMHRRGEEVEDAANRVIQTTGGKTGAEKVGAPSESDRSWATAGSDEQISNVLAGSPKRITPRALGSPGKEVRNVRTQTGRAIKRVRAQGPQYGQAMGAEGPGTGRQWGGQLPTNPEQRGEIAKRAIRPWGRFKNWRRVKRAQKAFKN